MNSTISRKKKVYVPKWYQEAIEMAKKSGDVDLSSSFISDITILPTLPTMKSLSLNFTSLNSLRGIKPQPNLRKLTADDSQLENLGGFLSFPNLTSLTLFNTPLESDPYLLTALVCLCPKLTTFNNRMIPDKYRRQAADLPDHIEQLLDSGWNLRLPISENEIEALLAVNQKVGLSRKTNSTTSQNQATEEESFEKMLEDIQQQHEKMVHDLVVSWDIGLQNSFENQSEISLSD